MEHEAQEVLRDILARHGRGLLENRRRCESCIRDTTLAKREINALVAALESGIPDRLAALDAPDLTTATMSNFVSSLSEESGLNDALARWSVEVWAGALDVRIDGAASSAPVQRQETPPVEPAPKPILDKPRETVSTMATASPRTAPSWWGGALVAVLLALQGIAFLLGQGNQLFVISIVFFLIGYACVLVAGALFRQPALGGWIGAGLSVFLVLCGIFTVNTWQLGGPPVTPATVALAAMGIPVGAACFVILIVGRAWQLVRRKAPHGGAWEREHAIAALVLAAALWGLWCQGLSVGSVLWSIEETSSGGRNWAIAQVDPLDMLPILFDGLWVWSWIKFVVDLALAWIAWVGLAGWKPGLRPGIACVLCLAGAVFGAIDQGAWLAEYPEFASVRTVVPYAISVAVDIAIAWFLWRAGVRKPEGQVEKRAAG